MVSSLSATMVGHQSDAEERAWHYLRLLENTCSSESPSAVWQVFKAKTFGVEGFEKIIAIKKIPAGDGGRCRLHPDVH